MPSSYYDLHGDTFFQQTVNIDMEAMRRRFLAHLKAGAEILDAGCGSGRDALAFGRAGYSVTAFDASAEMVKLAAAHTGIPVLQLNFEQMAWKEAFDGVWACASLLHVARVDLPQAFERITAALRRSGVLYASFKLGHEERSVGGRRFTDMNEALTRRLVQGAGLEIIDLWASSSRRPEGAGEFWMNVLGRRTV